MTSKNLKKLLTLLSAISIAVAFTARWLHQPPYISMTFYLLAIFGGGYFVFQDAVRGLFKKHFLNINFLVAIAALGALFIDQLAEAAAVVFFFSLAELFEVYGVDRARRALETLVKKSPQTATLKEGKTLPVEQVKVGSIVIAKAGDLIPLDGIVVSGSSLVDEATITGEPLPKDKREGGTVFAGTLNQNGYLEIKVTKSSSESTFTKIINLVEQAQKSRAPAQAFIDSFARYYTPLVVLLAIALSLIPPLVFHTPFVPWLYRALTLLVIACPCALVISTPVSIASALGGASKRGVLIKGGKYLELLGKVKAVAFDKTRTLTKGEPYIADIITFNGFSKEDVLADACGIEQLSSHPLSKSIVAHAQKLGIKPHVMKDYQNVAGKGNKAVCLVCDNLEHCVGNLKFIHANGVTTDEVLAKAEHLEKEGKTVVLVSQGNKVMGAIGIADQLREEAQPTVATLQELGLQPVMLTGDNAHVAAGVAEQVGIKRFFAALLPEQKVDKIKALKQEFGAVAMVGDGVNDAPSLVAADVGIAMGASGSDTAIETADVALMHDNLSEVPYAIRLGRRTLTTVKQNVTLALTVKAIFVVLALFGYTHLEWAIASDSGLALVVILNGLRLFG
ncbi:MAG: cation-translocating P-type ATPase [Candidatus Andersenbacteria bacterium]|nr:cation-translocating P-type ATPase [Candidatus Andersenbacteria bacterium]